MAKYHKKLRVCSNCNFEFKDENNYCPVCGQKNQDLNIPFKHLIAEVVESTLHLDSKFFKTIKFLVFKPGFLSLEFNNGKRTGYVPPIRLYVLISFVFFFFINILSNSGDEKSRHALKPQVNFSYQNISTAELVGLSQTQVDSIIEKRIRKTNFNTWIVNQLYKIANSSRAEFTHLLLKNISYMMFLLMPVMGVWIFVFHKNQLNYYMEGLIISVHFHSFVFFLFLILSIAASIFARELFFITGFVILPVYLLIVFRNYFKQKYFTTFIKALVVGMLYLFSLAVLMVLTIAVSIILV